MDKSKELGNKLMNNDQKKKVDQAQQAYKATAVTSKLVSENKEAVLMLGTLAGKGEETKAMISTSEIIN